MDNQEEHLKKILTVLQRKYLLEFIRRSLRSSASRGEEKPACSKLGCKQKTRK
jgi:hypothetical protein